MRLLRPIRVTVVLATILVSGVSGTLGAQSRTGFSKTEKPFATISKMFLKAPAKDSLIQLTKSQVGLRYKRGAKAPGTAFDCSGLVQWVLARFNVEAPRTSKEQSKLGVAIPKDPDALRPGDLLYFGKGKKVDHIGIYVGDGKFVHAANRKKGVVESALPTGRWATNWWKGVRRIFSEDESIDSLPATTIDSILSGRSVS